MIRNFKSNDTSQLFLQDDVNDVILFFGCIGSGKSSACMIKIFLLAHKIPPGYDGIRRSRWAIIRRTRPQLESTTIKTWLDWFPESVFGKVKQKSPFVHKIIMGKVEIEVLFLAVETSADVQKVKSLEVTGIFINEVQFFCDFQLILAIRDRTNRFPTSVHGGGFKRNLLLMDCNPPSTSHWIYRVFEKEKPDNWKIYKMPPALIKNNKGCWITNPNADFITQHPDPEYWLKLVPGSTEEHIKVSFCGEYGVLEDGRAVHTEYNDLLHYSSSPICANENVEIGLGWDFGNTPACIVVQLMPDGQLVVLDEFWTEYMSVREFSSNIVLPFLDRLYPFWRKNYISVHDPSGDSMTPDGGACQLILREMGIISIGAQSNAAQFRRDGLKYFLTKMSSGNPSFRLSEKCFLLREGLMGKFKYQLIRSTAFRGDPDYQEKPLKNIWSHSCEALEYICTHYASNKKTENIARSTKEIASDFFQDFQKTSKLRGAAWQR